MASQWELSRRFRAELLAADSAASREILLAYSPVRRRLIEQIDELARLMEAAQAAGEELNPYWLLRQERYARLLRQVEGEIAAFASQSADVIQGGQVQAVEAALAHSAELMAAGASISGLSASFARLPAEAVYDLVGRMRDGTPLRELFDPYGPEASRRLREALTTGLATGQGPRELARVLVRDLGGDLVRALRVARNEPIRSYREASHRAYERNADVLDGWMWISALTRRTCAACWAQHGTVHPLSERLDDHICGRCTAIPLVRGSRPNVHAGVARFSDLDGESQRYVLGAGAYALYAGGKITLADLVGWKHDARWGRSMRVRSLRELVRE